jgi:FkbM family methyltransferase
MRIKNENRSLVLRAYRKYLRAGDHPTKLRLIRLLERLIISEGGAVFKVDAGFDMILHPRDHVEYRLIQTGIYEPLTVEFLRKNLRIGQVALLAGVNVGLHVMVCSKAVGETGTIVAIEPQPVSLLRARENFNLNSLPDNIRLVSAALGDKAGLLPMGAAPLECTGWGSFVLREKGKHPYTVGVHTVSEVLSQLDVRELDLMLLDVEGFELPVLRAMHQGVRPQILILEVHPAVLKISKDNARSYYDAVQELGYRCFDLRGNPAQSESDLLESNLICLLGKPEQINWLT